MKYFEEETKRPSSKHESPEDIAKWIKAEKLWVDSLWCIRRENMVEYEDSPSFNWHKKGKADVYLKNDFLPPELAYQQQDYDHSNRKLQHILKHL